MSNIDNEDDPIMQGIADADKIINDKNALADFLADRTNDDDYEEYSVFDQRHATRNYMLDMFKEGALQQKEKDDIIIAQNKYIKQLEARLKKYKDL